VGSGSTGGLDSTALRWRRSVGPAAFIEDFWGSRHYLGEGHLPYAAQLMNVILYEHKCPFGGTHPSPHSRAWVENRIRLGQGTCSFLDGD
jgi:hypothetical protein